MSSLWDSERRVRSHKNQSEITASMRKGSASFDDFEAFGDEANIVKLNGHPTERLPNTLNIFRNIDM